MASNRMHRGLVALSASAVAAVYLTGYVRTQAADSSIGAAALPSAAPGSVVAVAAAAPPASAVAVLTPGALRPTPGPGQSTTAPTTTVPRQSAAAAGRAPQPPTAAPQTSSQTASAFKDGTYTGQGTSRRGDVWVSVQIQAGRIANVSITRSTLQYPVRDIAGLPAQVVQRQSAQVDIVSRATFSSQAFRGAIAQALSKAA